MSGVQEVDGTGEIAPITDLWHLQNDKDCGL